MNYEFINDVYELTLHIKYSSTFLQPINLKLLRKKNLPSNLSRYNIANNRNVIELSILLDDTSDHSIELSINRFFVT